MVLSIIIPVYNVEKYVEKCLISCIAQDLSNKEYEIIIINDGTKDNSLQIIERIAKDYPNIFIVSQNNAGLSAARNKGLSLAKGDYIWFVDSDDWIKKDCINNIVNKCKKENLDILAFCAASTSLTENTPQRIFDYGIQGVMKGTTAISDVNFQVSVPCSVYRRCFLLDNNLHFYEGIFYEDSEFTPRSYYLAERIAFINDIFYFIYNHSNSITRTTNLKKALDCLTVAHNLSKFHENISDNCKDKFNYLISMNINSSINIANHIQKYEIKEFNQHVYDNRILFKHLIKSKVFKYKIEGILFKLFPRNAILIYRLMQMLNKKPK